MEPAILQDQPFWAGVRLELLPALIGAATLESAPAGRYLFHEGEPASSFYLIRQGSVALEAAVPGRGPVTIQTLGAGDPLGFSWFYPPHQWHFDARTIEPCELIRFDAARLRELSRTDPEFGRELAWRMGEVMLQRLQATRMQLMDIYGHHD